MRSGTEKRKNPCEAPLGRYLRALERPATTRRLRLPRKPKPEQVIHEPPMPRQKTRPRDRKTKRRENMSQYDREVLAIGKMVKSGELARIYPRLDKPDRIIAVWRLGEVIAAWKRLMATQYGEGLYGEELIDGTR